MTILLLFQFGFLFFISLLWLLWLGLLKLYPIIVGGVDILSSSWSQIKCFCFFLIENNVCCGFFVYGLYYVEVVSLHAHFLESFYRKQVLNFIKSIFCMYWYTHKFLMVLCFCGSPGVFHKLSELQVPSFLSPQAVSLKQQSSPLLTLQLPQSHSQFLCTLVGSYLNISLWGFGFKPTFIQLSGLRVSYNFFSFPLA